MYSGRIPDLPSKQFRRYIGVFLMVSVDVEPNVSFSKVHFWPLNTISQKRNGIEVSRRVTVYVTSVVICVIVWLDQYVEGADAKVAWQKQKNMENAKA